jgi:hypothetical protein
MLECMQAGALALIITMVSLPGITGHEAMKAFEEYGLYAPAPMISGLPDVDVMRQCRLEPRMACF